MWSILLSPADDEKDSMVGELWERGTVGILEEPCAGLRAFFQQEDAVQALAREFAAIASGLREETVQASLDGSDWEPVYAGKNFVIVPKGQATAADFDGRILLEVSAGMAFGSGRHETTQLCLEALETMMKGGEMVVDVGCGSGILSLAAQHLGAAAVIACDIQEDAVRTAREHFNGALFRGSADAIRDSTADIVLANISARINDRIAGDLRRIMKASGVLIASGFITENPPRCFAAQGELMLGDWLCWICNREGVQLGESSVGVDVNVHPENWCV